MWTNSVLCTEKILHMEGEIVKIVMLNGQNHKGSSYHIGRMIADKIEGKKEIKEFFFPRNLDHFCVGCYKCIENMSECPYYDEKRKIIDAIDSADILIVTTPTYCMHMSAPLKSFFDLTFDLWMSHRPMESMFKKKAVIVSTAAGTGMWSAMKDVEDCLFYLGIPKIYKLGMAVQAMNWNGVTSDKREKIGIAADKIAKKLSRNVAPSVGIKMRFMFEMMGMMQKKGWNSSPIETQYWREKGWLNGKKPWK